jgi:hypothetical protein
MDQLQAAATIQDLPGLPAGVKFDPTDQELLEHLEGKARPDTRKLHPLIDEFIPAIEGENGICYTHPERLPGTTVTGYSHTYSIRSTRLTSSRHAYPYVCAWTPCCSSVLAASSALHQTGSESVRISKGKDFGLGQVDLEGAPERAIANPSRHAPTAHVYLHIG